MSSKGTTIAVASLAVGLAALGIYASVSGTATTQLLIYIAIGLGISTVYLVRGGTLPEYFYRHTRVNRDDDPANLSPRLYLSILLAAILIAAVVIALSLDR